jgi:hypothetical protein
MQQRDKLIKSMLSSILLSTATVTGSAIAGAGTVDFTVNIRTTEFLLPAETCASGMSGIGIGAGTTNLFTRKPATDKTTAVLSSFDCVTPGKKGNTFFFGPGKFTLTGPDGETIFATYSGTLYPAGVNPVSGLPVFRFDKDAMFNIQGGTGRYAKAVGSGTLSGTETINQATGTAQGILSAVGRIVY